MKVRRCGRIICRAVGTLGERITAPLGGGSESNGTRGWRRWPSIIAIATVVVLGLLVPSGGRVLAEELRLALPDADAAPAEVVAALESALLASMRAGKAMGSAQRRDALRPVVERVFDFPRMGRFIFGSTWFALRQDQAESFVEAFAELSLATYAARFREYSGQSFRLVSAGSTDGQVATVRTRLLRPGNEPIDFEYLLIHGDAWRVSSVTADGINDLALRRSLYSELHDSGGVGAVISEMQAQIEVLTDE